jgi:CheY-like chemotaxis protein/two-component sensor histidine kinase
VGIDVLDISKIEAGHMTTERVDVSLASLLLATEKIMRPRATQKQREFRMQILDPLPARAFTDPTRLRQILLNLLGNAVKFTDAGYVRVRVRMMRRTPISRLVVEIEDSGQGLTQDQAAILFKPFSQADVSITRRHGGTGLGLTISRQLARLLGGDVMLQQSEPGRGSIFRLEIDVEVPPDCEWGTEAESEQKPAPAEVQRLVGRILLAEDGIDNQRLIALHLTRAGATVSVAENGRLALELLLRAEEEGNRFDMLVTDMQMPEMDGYQLAETLRTRGFSVPILALTAHAMVEDRQRCLDAGCDEFVNKPIDSKVLISTCARLLRPRDADLPV